MTSRRLVAQEVEARYCFTQDVDCDAYTEAEQILSSDERQRAERFVFERDRRSFVLAHSLLRRVLSACDDRVSPEAWTFATGAWGKPRLSTPFDTRNLEFNLTHTSGLVACIVSRGADVGIDVEAIDCRVDAIALAFRYFSRAEAADLECLPERERGVRFAELWTLKEAYVKGTGVGLAEPLDRVSFAFEGASRVRCRVHDGIDAEWQLALFAPSDRHRMAIAVRSAQ